MPATRTTTRASRGLSFPCTNIFLPRAHVCPANKQQARGLPPRGFVGVILPAYQLPLASYPSLPCIRPTTGTARRAPTFLPSNGSGHEIPGLAIHDERPVNRATTNHQSNAGVATPGASLGLFFLLINFLLPRTQVYPAFDQQRARHAVPLHSCHRTIQAISYRASQSTMNAR